MRIGAPPGCEGELRETIMNQMMQAINRTNVRRGTNAARYAAQVQAQVQGATVARKVMGFAIVTSGFAVIAAQALQHAFGG